MKIRQHKYYPLHILYHFVMINIHIYLYTINQIQTVIFRSISFSVNLYEKQRLDYWIDKTGFFKRIIEFSNQLVKLFP